MKNRKIYSLCFLILILGIVYATWSYQEKKIEYLTLSEDELEALAFFNGTWLYTEDDEITYYTINITNHFLIVEVNGSIYNGYITGISFDEKLLIGSLNKEQTVSYGMKEIDAKHLFLTRGNPIESMKGNSGTMGIELVRYE
jgi:hypothetical protein